VLITSHNKQHGAAVADIDKNKWNQDDDITSWN
jgi:hypothetical protein